MRVIIDRHGQWRPELELPATGGATPALDGGEAQAWQAGNRRVPAPDCGVSSWEREAADADRTAEREE